MLFAHRRAVSVMGEFCEHLTKLQPYPLFVSVPLMCAEDISLSFLYFRDPSDLPKVQCHYIFRESSLQTYGEMNEDKRLWG